MGGKKTAVGTYRLEDQVGHLLRRAHQRATAIFLERLNGARVTPTQFAALAKLADEGELSQNHLGRLTAMDPATMKGVIGRLHRRRLIASKADAADRRRTLWSLTAAGKKLLGGAIEAGLATSNQALAPLDGKEQKILQRLLSRLT